MLSWADIERDARDHFDHVEAVPPWIRLQATDARGRLTPVALTRAALLGHEAVKLVAFACPAARLSVMMALALNDHLDAGLALFQGNYAVRLVLPTAALSWDALRRAVDHLVVNARFVRHEVARAEKTLGGCFSHYGE